MHKKYVLISLVTHQQMKRDLFGKKILSLFYEQYPTLAPQFANFHEPVNNPIKTIDEALEFWVWENFPIFLCRRKTSIVGSWWINKDIKHIGGLRFNYNWNNNVNWHKLFNELISASKAFFGYIHVFTDREIVPSAAGSAISSFLHGTPGHSLEKGIPNLGWANYFGEEYVKEIDVPLLQKNGFNIQKLGDGYVFNVTANLSDVINSYDEFNERRKVLKSLFRPELFQKYEPYG